MRKTGLMIMLTVAVLTAASCKDWLEATSSTQIQADDLFDSRSGFYDAISGVYIGMGDESAYGASYTWYVNDLTAFPYQYVTTYSGYYFQTHSYERSAVEDAIDAMWSEGYNIIANINLILRELEENADVIPTEDEFNLMKGEMLGLRAYIHFDLMRMFGLNSWDGDNATKLTVPYVVEFDREPTQQLSYSETSALLLQDINDALTLMYNDPVTGRERDDFQTVCNQESFWDNRTKHLNYYALEGLAARVYQWMGDTGTAAEYASDVIENAIGNGVVSWADVETLITTSDFDSRDWTFSTEHLFSLEVTGLGDSVENDYFYTLDSRYSYSSSFISSVLFADPVAGGEDIRGTALQIRYTSGGYRSYKLYTSDSYAYIYRNRMPMIKIAEMYYIVAENLIAQGDNDGALAAMNEVRSHRGISDDLDSTTDAATELNLEYYREFVCEGQVFYWLKHNQAESSINSDFTVSATDLIYPYPDDETDYGRVQEY